MTFSALTLPLVSDSETFKEISTIGEINSKVKKEILGRKNNAFDFLMPLIWSKINLSEKASVYMKEITTMERLSQGNAPNLAQQYRTLVETKIEEWMRLKTVSGLIGVDFFHYPILGQIDQIIKNPILRTTSGDFHSPKHKIISEKFLSFAQNSLKDDWLRFLNHLFDRSENNNFHICSWLVGCNDEQWQWFKNLVQQQPKENLRKLFADNNSSESMELIKVALKKKSDDLFDLLLPLLLESSPHRQQCLDDLLADVLMETRQADPERTFQLVTKLLVNNANPSVEIDRKPCLMMFLRIAPRPNFQILEACVKAGFALNDAQQSEAFLKAVLSKSCEYCQNDKDALSICATLNILFDRFHTPALERLPIDLEQLPLDARIENSDLDSSSDLGLEKSLLMMVYRSATGGLAKTLATHLPDHAFKYEVERNDLARFGEQVDLFKTTLAEHPQQKVILNHVYSLLCQFQRLGKPEFIKGFTQIIDHVHDLSKEQVLIPYTPPALSTILDPDCDDLQNSPSTPTDAHQPMEIDHH